MKTLGSEEAFLEEALNSPEMKEAHTKAAKEFDKQIEDYRRDHLDVQ